jgi:phage terminase small subunit
MAANAAGTNVIIGHGLLRKPEIAARIQELSKAMLNSADITAQRVMLELGRVAFGDIRGIYDQESRLRPVHEFDDDAAATIAGIETETRTERGLEQVDEETGLVIKERVTVTTHKVRRYEKTAALAILAKHFKIIGDEGSGLNALASALADRLKLARQRKQELIEHETIDQHIQR